VWTNSLNKGAVFLSAGNMRRAAGSPSMDIVRGMSVVTPRSAAIFITGMFAVTACPPFGPFFSELQILRAALGPEHPHKLATAVFLACLLLAFFGMTRVVFGIADGRPSSSVRSHGKRFAESAEVIAPPLLLLALSLWLGLFTPSVLREAWLGAVAQLFPSS
jgi:hydrogenase-4 component F